MKPRNSRVAQAESPSDLNQRLALSPSRQGFLPLIGVSLSLRPNRTPRACAASALRRSGRGLAPAQLGQSAQHREHQPPVRCCRVGPSIREGPEPRTGLGGRVQDVEEVPRRAGQPIQPRDQQHIPSTQRRDSAAYLLRDPGAMPSATVGLRWTSDDGKDGLNVVMDAWNDGVWGYNNLQWIGFTYYHKFNDYWHIAFETWNIHERNVPNLNNPAAAALIANGGTPFSPQFTPFNAPNAAQCNNPAC